MSVKVPLQWKNGRLIPVLDTDLADFPGEVWKQVPDFEHYEISNYGRVKSLARVVETKAGSLFPVRERIVKLAVMQDKDWISVSAAMTRDGHRYSFRVPRLVYNLFTGPLDYDNLSILVKRLDGDPLNLYFENLVLEDRGEDLRLPVHRYDQEGNFEKTYVSIHDASEELGIPISQIKDAAREKHLQGKKYYWRGGEPQPVIEVPDKEQRKQARIQSQFRRVQKMSLDGEPLEIFESLKAAVAAVNGGSENTIITACRNPNRTAYGFKWRYVDAPRKAPLADGADNASGNNIVTPYNRPVYQYTMKGVLLRRYESAAEAAKVIGAGSGAITNAINEQSQLVKGYYWRYAVQQDKVDVHIDVSAYEKERANYLLQYNRVVQKLARDGAVLRTFESLTAAANDLGVTGAALLRACKHNTNCKGYKWRYAPA